MVDRFITKLANEIDIERPIVDQSFINSLIKYHWPGNVRELINVLEVAISLSNGLITQEHLPDEILYARDFEPTREEDRFGLREQADEVEREAIIKAIDIYNGNKIKVSEALGISRSSLYNKMKKYNIELKG